MYVICTNISVRVIDQLPLVLYLLCLLIVHVVLSLSFSSGNTLQQSANYTQNRIETEEIGSQLLLHQQRLHYHRSSQKIDSVQAVATVQLMYVQRIPIIRLLLHQPATRAEGPCMRSEFNAIRDQRSLSFTI